MANSWFLHKLQCDTDSDTVVWKFKYAYQGMGNEDLVSVYGCNYMGDSGYPVEAHININVGGCHLIRPYFRRIHVEMNRKQMTRTRTKILENVIRRVQQKPEWTIDSEVHIKKALQLTDDRILVWYPVWGLDDKIVFAGWDRINRHAELLYVTPIYQNFLPRLFYDGLVLVDQSRTSVPEPQYNITDVIGKSWAIQKRLR